MKKQYSLKSRALAVVMCIIMVLGMLPVDSIAAEETLEYGKLDMLTSGAVITGNETADIKVSYTEGSVIAWSAADPSISP